MEELFTVVEHVVLVFIATALGVLFHERFRELARNIERYRLGRWLFAPFRYVERLLAALGIVSFRGVLPANHWAGVIQYEEARFCGECREWLKRQARILRDHMIDSDPGQSSSVLILAPPGFGATEVARELYRVFRRERESVFYFDCASLTRSDLRAKFISNVEHWTKTGKQGQQLLRLSDLQLFFVRHSFRSARRRAVAIICNAERLMEPVGEDESSLVVHRHCLDILSLFLRSNNVPLLVTVDSTSAMLDVEPIASWINDVPNQKRQEDLLISSDLVNGMLEGEVDRLRSRVLWKHGISCHNLELLSRLVRFTRDPDSLLRTARELVDQPGLSSFLFEEAIKECALEYTKEVELEHWEVHRQVALYASVINLLECPVPSSSIRALWTRLRTSDGKEWLGFSDDMAVLARPVLLDRLTYIGIVDAAQKDDEVARQTVYNLRPSLRNLASEFLDGNAANRSDLVEAAARIIADLEPPGITPLSRYLSEGDFRPLQDLLGFIIENGEREVLRVPLPPEICALIDSIRVNEALPSCSLRMYQWADRGGRMHTDLVGILSPTEFCQAHRLYRISVHIVSREGTGRQVQRALEPFVHEFILVEGDAYRCGPGGCIEILALLKEEFDVRAIEESVLASLRRGVDDYAYVHIVSCTPAIVVKDFARNTQEIAGGLSVEETVPEIYGSASRYSLVARGLALTTIKRMVADGVAPEVKELRVSCIYSTISAQAFFSLGPLNLRKQVRAQVFLDRELRDASDHVTLRFMDSAEDKINLLKLRHGPGSSYLVDFEIPAASSALESSEQQFGVYARQVVERFSKELEEHGVRLSPVNGMASLANNMVEYESEVKAFGVGPWIKHGVYDLVSSPEMFHRFMRKHLFIPDSDAAAVALACQFLTSRKENYRVLEIGSGTGALTEKLILAGIDTIDSVEPDRKLSEYWLHLRDTRGLSQRGQHYQMELEEFAAVSVVKYDLIISQGLHHHIPEKRQRSESEQDDLYRLTFLRICRDLLRRDGVYVLSDEFLTEYTGHEQRRLVLDRWYRHVISSALADGYPELADMEFRFWMNDQSETAELKESIETFQDRLRSAGHDTPFVIESVTRFGLTSYYGGGFAVLVLKPSFR